MKDVTLVDGCFRSEFKKAVIRSLLKMSGLDANQNRPVSNLSFLSKRLQKVVQTQFQSFVDSNNLMPTTQSAYHQFYSTETAVTNLYNHLLLAANSGHVLCFFLDLTAAFDTVDHNLLMLRLERQFGLCGIVLQWFRSYLSDRSYRPQDIINGLHRVLGTTGFGTWPASLHLVRNRFCR